MTFDLRGIAAAPGDGNIYDGWDSASTSSPHTCGGGNSPDSRRTGADPAGRGGVSPTRTVSGT